MRKCKLYRFLIVWDGRLVALRDSSGDLSARYGPENRQVRRNFQRGQRDVRSSGSGMVSALHNMQPTPQSFKRNVHSTGDSRLKAVIEV